MAAAYFINGGELVSLSDKRRAQPLRADVAAAYFINSGELVSVSDKRRAQPLRAARWSAPDTPYGGWLPRCEYGTIYP